MTEFVKDQNVSQLMRSAGELCQTIYGQLTENGATNLNLLIGRFGFMSQILTESTVPTVEELKINHEKITRDIQRTFALNFEGAHRYDFWASPQAWYRENIEEHVRKLGEIVQLICQAPTSTPQEICPTSENTRSKLLISWSGMRAAKAPTGWGG